MQHLVHRHFGIGENKNTIQLPTAENFLIFKPLNPVESQAEIIWQKCVRHSSALKGKYIVQIRTDSVSTEIVNSNGARQKSIRAPTMPDLLKMGKPKTAHKDVPKV